MEHDKQLQHPYPTSEMSLAVAAGVPNARGKTSVQEAKRWFIAIVMNNTEKSCCKKLNEMFSVNDEKTLDFETYVPFQKELHVWRNGRRKKVDRILFPAYVFIHCTEAVRKTIKANAPFINSFMKDRAGQVNEFGIHPFAFIPEHQMQSLQRMVGDAETPIIIDPHHLHIGTKVRVKGGKLDGFEGRILREPKGKTSVFLNIDFLGCAKVEMPLELLEMI